MNSIKSNGIVINEVNVGESDKILTVLLKDIGKVSVYAKGARNTKSKFLCGAQLFSYSEFVIFTGKGKFALSTVNLIDSFYNIRNDYDTLCYGYYFLEMVNKLILEHEPCNDVLLLLITALSKLAKGKMDAELVCGIFELKFLEINGYHPASEFCFCCNKDDIRLVFFGENGLLCKQCSGEFREKILTNEVIVYVLNFILKTEIKKLFSFSIPKKDIKTLHLCAKLFIKNNMDIRFKSISSI